SFFLELLRQVPMVQGNPGLNTQLQGLVNQPVVIIYSFSIDRSDSCGNNARPGKRKPKFRNMECLKQPQIFLISPVKIAALIYGMHLVHFTFFTYELIPDRAACAVAAKSSFCLIGRGRNAPLKGIAKLGFVKTNIVFL